MDLNIVAVPVQEPPQGESSLRSPKKKTKRRNKYERRRQKAKQARDQKEKQRKEQEGEACEVAEDDGDNAIEMTAEQPPVEARSSLRVSSDDEHSRDSNDIPVNRLPPVEKNPDVVETDDSSQSGDDEDDMPSSSNDGNRLPDDTEERARYLAEFHARPMELDRRAGARGDAAALAARNSKSSTHLFSEATEWDSSLADSLHSRLRSTLQSHPHFKLPRPTKIQSAAIPAFCEGDRTHNLLIQSETGSGKTLAYLLPIVQSLAVDAESGELRKMDRAVGGTRCVILCPTRELAIQTLSVAEQLCAASFNWLVPGCLFGEERRKSEKARIRKGLSILVATPGRLLDHLTRTEALLMALKGKLEWLVLDEADRLLDMGLGDQVKQIVQRIRANQPKSGRNGITWRSVLLSATVTPSVEALAKETLMGGDSSWKWVKGTSNSSDSQLDDSIHGEDQDTSEYANSTPRQLSQYHMMVSAKLRLAALVAFLAQRAEKGERVVVFMSTCAAVDYYHALFEAMDSILSNDNNSSQDESSKSGIFGRRCSFYRLHGNVPHGERQLTLRKFVSGTKHRTTAAAVLLATDVAARGLNLPEVDWTVQYDPPSEVADYIHRAGRVARAGRAGHSLLFLLPSERPFLDVLQKRGVNDNNNNNRKQNRMIPLSLSATLTAAAEICRKVTQEGLERSGHSTAVFGGDNDNDDNNKVKSKGRLGEAFSSEIQYRLETCVSADDRKSTKSSGRRGPNKQVPVAKTDKDTSGNTDLLEKARLAFVSHIRAYPTKEKAIRPIFSAKALHLGHVARSFALKEAPKKLATSGSVHPNRKTRVNDDNDDEPIRNKRKAAMAFVPFEENNSDNDNLTHSNKRNRTSGNKNPRQQKELFLANASKLGQNGLDTL